MTGLFIIESQSAGEGMTPPGPWSKKAEADTLDEAKHLEKLEYAHGWRYTRIVADIEKAEAMRKDLEQLRGDLEWLTAQRQGSAGGKVDP